ncbi:MAG: hypothetical protein EXS51_01415 [Candidatus Taylorbacteria bacterium]|nr:hypothetical protein [Candidatus Taylorbacteria bacterium]
MVEEIPESYVEPQAQEAVRALEAKGYSVGLLAGSAGNPVDGKQAIIFTHPKWEEGKPTFDETTADRLKSAGFEMYSGAVPVGTIGFEFRVETGDARVLEAKWRELATILPSLKG